jgi:hypothetical protein
MKKLLIMTFVMVALLMSSSAFAQKKMAAYIGGTVAMPMSPEAFSDYWKMGFGGLGGFSLEMSPGVEVGVMAGYSSFPFDEDKLLESVVPASVTGAVVEITGADLTALEIMAFGKYTFGSGEAPFKPYFIGLAGLDMLSVDDATICVDVPGVITIEQTVSGPDESAIALGFGAGFDYAFNPSTGLWMDVRYMLAMTEGESTAYLPIRAGLKFMFGGNGE